MKICVMGLGYIGLPTAVMFAKHGAKVHGVDINENVINTLVKRDIHIHEPGLQELLIEVIDLGNFTFSSAPKHADVFIIAVPTPISSDKKADLSFVLNAVKMILPYLQKGNLIVLESTVPPGTIHDKLIPALKKTPLKIGDDLFISHSPERVLPGNMLTELILNDRIIGGINETSNQMTVHLYKHFLKGKLHVTDSKTAELVKLIENTYRDVNIALANELAVIGEKLNINIWEAIKLANCHPRVNLHSPGPGVGGHCIAVDPWFIIEQVPNESPLISLARKMNDSIPMRMTKMIEDSVKSIKKPLICILGLSYKGNVDDIRESPALSIISNLKKKGYQLRVFDPHVKLSFEDQVDHIEKAVDSADCLVILTDHDEFSKIDFKAIKNKLRNQIIIDTHNILNHQLLKNEGFHCIQIGTPF
ncbi:nucleotide sugar dehydrogenase [Bacillus aquiflavi]|uniref:nucleotide sugar dehydrogenase n=1 Tax=Bacillus aquiflavi TaxID=2672567 RepID=UPI001CA81D4B|nr:nucleotide sugar dehydrogenase [Bacillus aquiflavi]UAC49114.1 nucleotide sugar dehydrogenase [Bacillus aquiflavi]